MSSATKGARRSDLAPKYKVRKGPKEGTPLALTYLKSYLDGKPNRWKATASLLGCSPRTAKRIVSKQKPYTAAMKMSWIENICRAVGKTTIDVLGVRTPKTYKQAIAGWNHARNPMEAMQFASDCALSIAYVAQENFKLFGSYTLSFHGGMPTELSIALTPRPEMSHLGGDHAPCRLVITSEKAAPNLSPEMMLSLVTPKGGMRGREILTWAKLEQYLKKIHALFKNFTAVVQRELLR